MNIMKNILGKITKELRKAQGMSQKELADRSELHVNTIFLVEIGAVEVKLSTLFFLAKGLNIDLGEFMALFVKKFREN